MLVVVCLILNILILLYFGRKGFKGTYNLYLSFVFLMGLMSLFYISLPEINETIQDYLGSEGYRSLKYVIVGSEVSEFTPLIAIEVVTTIVTALLAINYLVEAKKNFHIDRILIIVKTSPYVVKRSMSKPIERQNKKYEMFCAYLC